jgi:hypothetical protein
MNDSDNLDKASELSELWLENQIQNVLVNGAMNPMRGEALCIKCSDRNDRAPIGYGVCSHCVEADE